MIFVVCSFFIVKKKKKVRPNHHSIAVNDFDSNLNITQEVCVLFWVKAAYKFNILSSILKLK